jgi:DNA helicase HerA-like ATPase
VTHSQATAPEALRLSHDFSIPAEAVTQTFAILAKRGVGKTYTAAVMTEEFLKLHLPVVEGGTFRTYLGKLKTLELIEGPRHALRASEELF